MTFSTADLIKATNDAEEEGRANACKEIVAWLRKVAYVGVSEGERAYLGAAMEIERGTPFKEST